MSEMSLVQGLRKEIELLNRKVAIRDAEIKLLELWLADWKERARAAERPLIPASLTPDFSNAKSQAPCRRNDKHNNKIKENTMKPRFEEHEGQLFRMLDKPVPLAPDAEMPCLVQLIQDDSPMGRNNKNRFPSYLEQKFIIKELDDGKYIEIEKWFFPAHNSRFEIIGYPVQEGSRWWALYQMMQGHEVCNPYIHGGAERFAVCDGRIVHHVRNAFEDYCAVDSQFFPPAGLSTGWKLYKEPKPETAKEQFEVGDWVEFIDVGGRKSQGKYLSNTDGNAIIVLEITCNMRVVVHTTKIIRKLKPSEVVIQIGCLRGTVKRWDSTTFHIFHGNSKFLKMPFDALDSYTRELVESLLKAQEEEK